MCNGHADTCDILDPKMPKKLVCRCQHNTCGAQCATCCKGFEQKKWQQSTAFKKFTCERENNFFSSLRTTRPFFVRFKPKVTLFHEAKDLLLLVACNCFGHSDECEYDTEVDEKHLSLDIHGNYEGGGVCKNCRDNTEGINCNRCKPMFYRPRNKPLNATDVCQRES